MDADQELAEDQLPQGLTPIWIQPPDGATQVQMLERVEDIVAGRYQDVMVLYYPTSDERAAASWCGERGWQYHSAPMITGCEAQCVIVLHCVLHPEYITRGINMLIIVNRW